MPRFMRGVHSATGEGAGRKLPEVEGRRPDRCRRAYLIDCFTVSSKHRQALQGYRTQVRRIRASGRSLAEVGASRSRNSKNCGRNCVSSSSGFAAGERSQLREPGFPAATRSPDRRSAGVAGDLPTYCRRFRAKSSKAELRFVPGEELGKGSKDSAMEYASSRNCSPSSKS